MVNKQNQRSRPLVHFSNKGRDIHACAPNNSNEPCTYFFVWEDWAVSVLISKSYYMLLLRKLFSTFHGQNKNIVAFS